MIARRVYGLLLVAGLLLTGTAMAEEAPVQQVEPRTAEERTLPTEAAAPSGETASDAGQPKQPLSATDGTADDDEYTDNNGIEEVSIADPIEPLNRLMFKFNDKLYFWALKPAAQGYSFIVPEPARVSVKNFFSNVKMPIRFVNTLLQGKFEGASTELARFCINSTMGLAGFFDVAKSHFELNAYDEDFGQTLGFYGMGGMMYIVWPVMGPSTLRDSVGMAGDSVLNPASYITPFGAALGVKVFEVVNKTSLELGTYEDIIAASVEPYIGVRDGFIQLRKKQINK
ncbi:MlaA family lipoprotein [Pelobacter propionicus]|uniref:VacJ family lipoprotein n=1 Tax=Pelobacter propionicus (strain DSM 2379 / NBRC 103807 / OttBd1) TaxID=338966 RepID=A1ALH0_PELPD|nr:VacJ family lipoprotein [Pelobacter propionicus]ABK98190.1 VacJ family lipoprotein [Pelobacter propionicus DSM 2379]